MARAASDPKGGTTDCSSITLTTPILSARGGHEALATTDKTPGTEWIVMSIAKACADRLRQNHATATGGRLGSGHAHELTAAFFGYGAAAALRAEKAFPLENVANAKVLIPDLVLMDRRRGALQDLPDDLADSEDLAQQLIALLIGECDFVGAVWLTRDLKSYIAENYLHENFSTFTDELSGEMAETNAYFDELMVDEVDVTTHVDSVVAEATGELNGEQDQDRTFMGDKITFHAIMTLPRAAGRTVYFEPVLHVSGSVDDSAYYDVD